MFELLTVVVDKSTPNMDTHVRSNVHDFIIYIIGTVLIAHFFACTWLGLGLRDTDAEEGLRRSWAA